MLGGTSLTSGRLCNPPLPWTYFLYEDMIGAAECKGPVIIINTGKGSQTSDFGAAQAILMAPLKPTHVLMEDFGINDCAIGPVTIPQATANFNSMVASYRASNPSVVIVHQTMSPASAADVNRTNLAAYYTNGLTNAALNGIISLDNYGGTAIVPGGWAKPLDPAVTVPTTPFAITPTTGFSGMANDTVWNAADKAGTITLSVDLLTATSNSASIGSVRANNAITGKKHIENTVLNKSTTYPILGIANASMGITSALGGSTTSIGLNPDGTVSYNGGSLGSVGFTLSSNDVIGLEIDRPANLIYFMKGAVRSAGFSISGITGSIYPALTSFTVSTGGTARFSEMGDGLHPLWAPAAGSAFQTYSYPNILAWAKAAMAAWWP